jgi:hypothetical protein
VRPSEGAGVLRSAPRAAARRSLARRSVSRRRSTCTGACAARSPRRRRYGRNCCRIRPSPPSAGSRCGCWTRGPRLCCVPCMSLSTRCTIPGRSPTWSVPSRASLPPPCARPRTWRGVRTRSRRSPTGCGSTRAPARAPASAAGLAAAVPGSDPDAQVHPAGSPGLLGLGVGLRSATARMGQSRVQRLPPFTSRLAHAVAH